MHGHELAWHALEIGDALATLGCDPGRGLLDAQVRERLATHGPNALPEPPRQPAWRVLLRQFKSPLIYILFIAAALAGGLGHLGDAAVILAVVLVNALILDPKLHYNVTPLMSLGQPVRNVELVRLLQNWKKRGQNNVWPIPFSPLALPSGGGRRGGFGSSHNQILSRKNK